jgi:hypothetical protein
MILNMSHDDKRKYREGRKHKDPKARVNRKTTLSAKSKDEAFKKLAGLQMPDADKSVQVDEHMKMSDNYMRTGPYQPKKK